MDHIDSFLGTKSESSQYSLSIHTALVMGKKAINRYYNKTDHLEVYWIVMSMYCLAFYIFST